MANISEYLNDNVLILSPREALYREFNVGQWTELRIGMLYTMVTDTSDTALPSDQVYYLSDTDRIYFGIKSSGSNFPGTGNADFIGATTITGSSLYVTTTGGLSGTTNASYPYYSLFLGASSASNAISTLGTFAINANLGPFSFPFSVGATCGFYGLKYVLENSGSADQRIIVSYKGNASTATSSAALYSTLVNNTSWNAMANNQLYSTASWATGIPLPNTFYAYLPFYKARLRMTAMQIVKVS
jgi:hypothetical protein